MNILSHEFIYNIKVDSGYSYICAKCNCEIDYIKEKGDKYLFWDRIRENYFTLISCDEFIIKNIIE